MARNGRRTDVHNYDASLMASYTRYTEIFYRWFFAILFGYPKYLFLGLTLILLYVSTYPILSHFDTDTSTTEAWDQPQNGWDINDNDDIVRAIALSAFILMLFVNVSRFIARKLLGWRLEISFFSKMRIAFTVITGSFVANLMAQAIGGSAAGIMASVLIYIFTLLFGGLYLFFSLLSSPEDLGNVLRKVPELLKLKGRINSSVDPTNQKAPTQKSRE